MADPGPDDRGPIAGPVPGLRSGAAKRNVLVALICALGVLIEFGLFRALISV